MMLRRTTRWRAGAMCFVLSAVGLVVAVGGVVGLGGCGSKVDPDPIATLSRPSLTGYQHRRAMNTLDASAPDQRATLDILAQVVSSDSYSNDMREEALHRLAKRNVEELKVALRRSVPRTESWGWLARVCEIIAENNWQELSPALVSSWARPVLLNKDELQRPEYIALATMHGEHQVTNLVFDLFVEARGPGQENLRTRCWDLLHRLGQRERLIGLVLKQEAVADDALLIDLKAGARELGLVPRNREEILWLRKLRDEGGGGAGRGEFWSRAVQAVQALPPDRRTELELRDLPILVSASLYEPDLIWTPASELYRRVQDYLKTQKRHVQESNYDGFADQTRQMLSDFRDQLTWGDLAAMLMAVRAMQVPQVVDHLFDYAERDRADTSTEYGGVIALDGKDRFEIREFQPVMRRHDQEFLASQAMLDAAYTSLFHFHLHAQKHRNNQYAGPGFGDVNYADNTRANCLVFTFMNKDTMNVDYYRHGRVVVDLGEIHRSKVKPQSTQRAQRERKGLFSSRGLELPLPLGEGWGEGQGAAFAQIEFDQRAFIPPSPCPLPEGEGSCAATNRSVSALDR